jgi:sulfur carrier protein
MNIFINQEPRNINASSINVEALIELIQPKTPFAIALNAQFISKTQYGATVVQENDQIEIISPVTGG